MQSVSLKSLGYLALITPVLAFSSTSSAAQKITFTEDIAPIFMENCVVCHRSGEVAPMALKNHAEARPWAKSIKKAVANRVMPPWDADPNVGSWLNDISLSQEDIDLIVAWVDQGAAKGPADAMPEVPEFPVGWRFGEPDLIVEFPKLEVPPGEDIYFDPKVAVQIPKGAWVQAIEIQPGNREVAHHINILAGDRPTMAGVKERKGT